MRQPVFSRPRRRTRNYRLARTAVAGTTVVLLLWVVGSQCSKSDPEPPTPTVSFSATSQALSDARARPGGDALKREVDAIVGMLNEWYQIAFVDPDKFGDGSFEDVSKLFLGSAKEAFGQDRAALTIGEAREEVKRVEPQTATAQVAVFFENGKTPRYATAQVRFTARATLEEEDARPIQIVQSVNLTLQKTPDGWRVSFYDRAKQTQDTIVPTPTPTS